MKGYVKKTVALLLTLALMLSLAACGGETAEPAAAAPAETAGEEAGQTQAAALVELEPVVVASSAEYEVVATAVDLSSEEGFCILHLSLTNHTSDKKFGFFVNYQFNAVSMYMPAFCEVEAGQTKEEPVYLPILALESLDMGQITDIGLILTVVENDRYELGTPLEPVHLYPLGQEAAAAYQWQTREGDILLFENDAAAAYIIGFAPDWAKGEVLTLNFYLVNKTDSQILFAQNLLGLGGMAPDEVFTAYVQADSSMVCSLGWTADDLALMGIVDVEEVAYLSFGLQAMTLGAELNVLAEGSATVYATGDEDIFALPNCDQGHKVPSWTIAGENMTGTCQVCGAGIVTPLDHEQYLNSVLKGRWICYWEQGGVSLNTPNYFATQINHFLPFLEFDGNGGLRTVIKPETEEYTGTWRMVSYSDEEEIPTYTLFHEKDGEVLGALVLGIREDGLELVAGASDTVGNTYTTAIHFKQESEDSAKVCDMMAGTWIFNPYYQGKNQPANAAGYSLEFDDEGLVTLHFEEDITLGYHYVKTVDDPNGPTGYVLNIQDGDWQLAGILNLYVDQTGGMLLRYASSDTADAAEFYLSKVMN